MANKTLEVAPEWMERYAVYIQKQLGITLDVVLGVRERPGGKRKNNGFTIVEARYNRATVIMQRDLPEAYLSYQDITHEYLHVSLAFAALAAGYLCGMLPEAAQRALGVELWTDGVEHDIEVLARALTPGFLAGAGIKLPKDEDGED